MNTYFFHVTVVIYNKSHRFIWWLLKEKTSNLDLFPWWAINKNLPPCIVPNNTMSMMHLVWSLYINGKWEKGGQVSSVSPLKCFFFLNIVFIKSVRRATDRLIPEIKLLKGFQGFPFTFNHYSSTISSTHLIFIVFSVAKNKCFSRNVL